jgi:hypothetical protein
MPPDYMLLLAASSGRPLLLHAMLAPAPRPPRA